MQDISDKMGIRIKGGWGPGLWTFIHSNTVGASMVHIREVGAPVASLVGHAGVSNGWVVNQMNYLLRR